jgi:uncharacterized membrane protein YphA (DoxX/SURF4 family)
MVKIRSSSSKPSNNQRGLIRKIPRWFVGLVLVSTGTGKTLDIQGFVNVLAAYDLMPSQGNVILAYSMPFIELATGVALLAGVFLPLAAWVATGWHTLLLTTVSVSLWRGLEIENCGCFGVFWARPLGVQTFVEDAVMLGLSLLVLWEARRTT